MLIAARPEKVEAVREVFAKWDLDAVEIGKVIDGGRMRVRFHSEIVVDVPVAAVVDLCPMYQRPVAPPAEPPAAVHMTHPLPADFGQAFLDLLASPTLADKEWVFRQYDHMVQTNTALLPGADAAVLRIKGTKKALAIVLDGNSLYAQLDPRTGGAIAVAEACRNLACVGARPVGVTNCMNFGNPEKPEVMRQFKDVISGLSGACRAFDIPVTGGNVSFYNDTEGASIYPTPVLGIVGLVKDIDKLVTPGFKEAGDAVILLGENKAELAGSEYFKARFRDEGGSPPILDLVREKAVQETCLAAAEAGLLRSAHDISEGGLAVCVAECAFLGEDKLGCELDLDDDIRADALLFGETQSRILVTVKPADAAALAGIAGRFGIRARVIGKVGGDVIRIGRKGEAIAAVPVKTAWTVWKQAIPGFFTTGL